MFSPSLYVLFFLFMVSFAVQKLVSLIRSHLFIFPFISFAFRHWAKKILLRFILENVLPMFCSVGFIVSCLIFRPLNHSEFIFVYGMRECSNIIDLHETMQFSQHHLLMKLLLLHCIFLPPLLKINSGPSILFHWSTYLSLCQYHTRNVFFLLVKNNDCVQYYKMLTLLNSGYSVGMVIGFRASFSVLLKFLKILKASKRKTLYGFYSKEFLCSF